MDLKRLKLDEYFETSDLSLSSTLVSLGFSIDCLDKSNPKVIFIFKSTPELIQTIQSFWAAKLKIEPRTYFNNLKDLKARIYSSEG